MTCRFGRHKWKILSKAKRFYQHYLCVCEICNEKEIRYVDSLDKIFKLFAVENPKEAYPEWYCQLCNKVGPNWGSVDDIQHLNIHLQMEIRNKPCGHYYSGLDPIQ